MLKTLLASASLSFAFLLLPLGSVSPISTSGSAGLSTAHAIDIGIELGGDDDGPTIGISGGDDDEGGAGDDEGDSAGDDDDDGGDRRISCSRGKRIVENAGFRRVRERDCKGKNFRYTGRRKGDNFEIRVSSRNGRIVSVSKR
jgi:hypothetical protein